MIAKKKAMLFVCKVNQRFQKRTGSKKPSGLSNSTRLIAKTLSENGCEAHSVQAEGITEVKRLIIAYNAKIVVIEALWMQPHDLKYLMQKFPDVKFCAHMHSEMPFLSYESNAMPYITEYVKMGVIIIANSELSHAAYKYGLNTHLLALCENLYEKDYLPYKQKLLYDDEINIACFGAIRPMKNQLIQAMAALEFSRTIGKKLRFHINSSRVEAHGQGVLNNLMGLFFSTDDAELECRGWIEPEDLLQEINSTIDIGMQMSMTETFNIVACDYTAAGVPMVVSPQIRWAHDSCKYNEHDPAEILKGLHNAYERGHDIVNKNRERIYQHNIKAKKQWIEFYETLLSD